MSHPMDRDRRLFDHYRKAGELSEEARRRWLLKLKEEDPELACRLEGMLAEATGDGRRVPSEETLSLTLSGNRRRNCLSPLKNENDRKNRHELSVMVVRFRDMVTLS